MKKLGVAWVCAAFLLIEVVYWALQMGLFARFICALLFLLYMDGIIDYIVHIWLKIPYWLPLEDDL